MKAQWSVLVILATIACTPLVGCSSDNKLDEGANIMSVDKAKLARQMFDKYNGDQSALTPADKETYLSYFDGDQERADKTWQLMANPPNSNPIQTQ